MRFPPMTACCLALVGALSLCAQAILYRAMYRSGALESELVNGSNPFLHRQKVGARPAEQHSGRKKLETEN